MTSPTLHEYEMSIFIRFTCDAGRFHEIVIVAKNRRNLRIWSKRNETTASMRTFFSIRSISDCAWLFFFRAPPHRAQVASNEHSEIWHQLLATHVVQACFRSAAHSLFFTSLRPLLVRVHSALVSKVVYGFNQKRFRRISDIISQKPIFYRMGLGVKWAEEQEEREEKAKKLFDAKNLKLLIVRCMRRWAVEPLNVIKKWSTSLKERKINVERQR